MVGWMKRLTIMSVVTLLLPVFAMTASADFDQSDVRVNQIGYFPGATKVATVIHPSTDPLTWQLRNARTGKVVAEGKTKVYGEDKASGDHLHHADFSFVQTNGSYQLLVNGVGESVPFEIGMNLYSSLPQDAMAYFYFHRMGIDLEADFLPDHRFAHKALHPGDQSVACFQDWCKGEKLNVRYSWADAGDFGIYPVNHAISAWILLNLYERNPQAFPDGSLNIPEKNNGIPDILDEVKFGSTFMKGLLPASGGLASHKVHNTEWSAFPVTDVDQENAIERLAQPPSTNATYAVARTMAHLARVMEPYQASYADEAWKAAKEAWKRAEAAPDVDYTSETPDAVGGGDYGDTGNADDRYAAAAEMYLTAYARKDQNEVQYQRAVKSSPQYRQVTDLDWAEVTTSGTLSLLTVANDLPANDKQLMKNNVINKANQYVQILKNEGYPVPLDGNADYWWGSNSSVANRMMLMGYAYDLSNDKRYLDTMNRAMDYLLGNNAMKLSYITGYGEYHESDTHDRWAWGKYQEGLPYPKGWLAGGPNNASGPNCDPAGPIGQPPAKSYAGKNTAPNAWCTKENTINWNAPLVWVGKYIHDHQYEVAGKTGFGRKR